MKTRTTEASPRDVRDEPADFDAWWSAVARRYPTLELEPASESVPIVLPPESRLSGIELALGDVAVMEADTFPAPAAAPMSLGVSLARSRRARRVRRLASVIVGAFAMLLLVAIALRLSRLGYLQPNLACFTPWESTT